MSKVVLGSFSQITIKCDWENFFPELTPETKDKKVTKF